MPVIYPSSDPHQLSTDITHTHAATPSTPPSTAYQTPYSYNSNTKLACVYHTCDSEWTIFHDTSDFEYTNSDTADGHQTSDYKTDFPSKADYFKADSETDSRTTTLYHTDNCKPNYSRATTLYHTDNCKPNYSHATTHYHTDNCKPNYSHTTTHYHTDNCKPNYSRTTTHYHTDNCKHNYSSTSDHKTTSTCKKYTKNPEDNHTAAIFTAPGYVQLHVPVHCERAGPQYERQKYALPASRWPM
ncbi:uncharacterized protein LOC142768336 [Rhipicephalus microplus]|uniref:uncharacterized protein LOC142768336 n=1 Tax=Rhipicephalus microplus TaxID=6941 RepID=UPI003F6A58C2